MDRIPAFGGDVSPAAGVPKPVNAKLEAAALAAHRATDKIADSATAQVGQLSGSVHRAVNSAADAATSAAEWASTVPDQAKLVQTRLTESAYASIRAKPLQTVAGALIIGYLLGRLTRL